MQTPSLFLHMGPGLNADAERLLLGPHCEHITFWNQPEQPSSDGAFLTLCEQTCKKIEQMAKATGKINIIAHSFGGNIAVQCLKTHSSYIEKCQFIGTVFYFGPSMLRRVMTYLSEAPETTVEFQQKFSDFLRNPQSPDGFWDYFGVIAQDPTFLRAYWHDFKALDEYVKTMAQCRPLDVTSFTNIVNDFLKQPEVVSSPYRAPIEIIYGEHDHLIDLVAEKSAWLKLFPQAVFTLIPDAGHFCHLEKDLNFI